MRTTPVNFDRLAPFYQAMEFLSAGGKLQRCRIEFLAQIPVPRRILLAGEGHGRFLPACVKQFPEAHITVIDLSERMLAIARSKVDSDQVEFVHADLLEWDAPHGGFDLIVTHFFLDCFPADELEKTISKLGVLAKPEADWLLADFETASKGIPRWRSRLILTTLYQFFGIATGLKARRLISPEGDLIQSGFTRRRRMTYEWGLLKSEWWDRRPLPHLRDSTNRQNNRVTV